MSVRERERKRESECVCWGGGVYATIIIIKCIMLLIAGSKVHMDKSSVTLSLYLFC